MPLDLDEMRIYSVREEFSEAHLRLDVRHNVRVDVHAARRVAARLREAHPTRPQRLDTRSDGLPQDERRSHDALHEAAVGKNRPGTGTAPKVNLGDSLL